MNYVNLNKIKFFYFLGIGGIGMSSLARYFNSIGKIVHGYDKNKTHITKDLENEGIIINYYDNIKFIPHWINSEKCLIVYTIAIPNNNNQWNFIKKNGKNIKKRSQVLAMITKNNISIAIGGAHGKTTTCTLLGHILYNSGVKITAFLGGISRNYRSNFISSGKDFFLTEADEFNHSFLYLSPNIVCITSIDQDHIDTYSNKIKLENAYMSFLKKIKNPYKKIFLCKEDSFLPKCKNAIYYSLIEKKEYYTDNIITKNNVWYFDFHTPKDVWKSMVLLMPGFHNIKNATAALSIADYLNISQDKIRKSLLLFKGIERRYTIHYQSNNNNKLFIDDYAHHPTEIDNLIITVRKCFHRKKILGIFQPHLFSRTKYFEYYFAKVLEKLDFLILLEIYPARESKKNYDNISSHTLIKKIKMKSKNKEIASISNVIEIINKKQFNFDIILTIGAGNIDTLIIPIKKWLYEKYGK
ncbi:UDP-N-acetylmuramate--L-alanine ligase [Blattabacterium cuenoti]|uniref:UDP-N-acetylmuramate--L-alanine ligase n=1 Tax=Blattabacterium cuenoti TaxID=1653831 RepID=UPI00163BA46A|nr:UDP-N-acetylmuramate--L-alanine ligase [Blattabacterium cuenoti]